MKLKTIAIISILLVVTITVSALTIPSFGLEVKDFTTKVMTISNEKLCEYEKASLDVSRSSRCVEAEKDELKKEVDVGDHLDITQNTDGVIRVRNN